MAMTETRRLEKRPVHPVSDEIVACIEALADTAFWQLMLGDDIEACDRDVELLVAAVRFRWAQTLNDVRHATLDGLAPEPL